MGRGGGRLTAPSPLATGLTAHTLLARSFYFAFRALRGVTDTSRMLRHKTRCEFKDTNNKYVEHTVTINRRHSVDSSQ